MPRSRTLIIAMALALALLPGCREESPLERWNTAPADVKASLWPEPVALPPFELLDQRSAPFTPERLRGRWHLVFFGFLQCPDVCPTTLSALRGLREQWRASNADSPAPEVILVSLDYQHDRPEAMLSYLAYFDPEFIGLVGSQDATQPLLQALHVMREESVDEQGVRRIDHTGSVFVIDPHGRAVGALSPPHHPESLYRRLRALQDHLQGE